MAKGKKKTAHTKAVVKVVEPAEESVEETMEVEETAVTKKAQKQPAKTKANSTTEPKKMAALLDDDDDDEKVASTIDNSADASMKTEEGEDAGTGKLEQKKTHKTGFTLFVGHLHFETSKDHIQEHFVENGCRVKNVRLITHKESGKSKGFGYIDFLDNKSLRLGLLLDKSNLMGKKINVEFTTIGGKNAKRLANIKEKNDRLRKFKKLPDTHQPGMIPFSRGIGAAKRTDKSGPKHRKR